MKRQLTVVDNTSDDRKETKLLKLNNKKINFFTQLPKELVYHVLTFIAGYDSIKINPLIGDVGDYKIENKDDNEEKELFKFDNNRTIEDLDKFIIPLENIKTLISLTCCTSKSLFFLKGNLSQTIIENISDNKNNEMKEEQINNKELSVFDKLWLNCYNFQEKLTYWIRTIEFENFQLSSSGFFIPKDKLAWFLLTLNKLQHLIQFKERGLTTQLFTETTTNDNNEENEDNIKETENNKTDENKEEENQQQQDQQNKKRMEEDEKEKFCNEEEALNEIKERLEKLMITEKEVLENDNLNNLFDLFITKAVILTLKIYKKFDCDANNIDIYKCYLMSLKYLDQYSVEGEFNNENNNDCKKYGLVINGPIAWKSFVTINGSIFIENNYTTNENTENNIENNNANVFNENVNIEENKDVKEKLNSYFYLHLQNVGFFNEEFKNLIFPNSILSFTFSSHLFYSIKPTEQWDNLFENVKFPNVKYLRIYFDEYGFDCGDDEYLDLEKFFENTNYGTITDYKELQFIILKNLLKKERFPKLNHLVLHGFTKRNLFEECDFSLLQQLLTIEFRFGLSSKMKSSNFFNEIVNLKSLKFVIIHCLLDPRLKKAISYEELENYYDLKDKSFVFSIGNVSLSEYFRYCNSRLSEDIVVDDLRW
ncbi:hypothetical protein ABK040_016470 [Willaertia magna]